MQPVVFLAIAVVAIGATSVGLFSLIVSCTQPDKEDKKTEKTAEKTESAEVSADKPGTDKTVVAKVNDVPIYKNSLDNNLDNPLKEAIIREVLRSLHSVLNASGGSDLSKLIGNMTAS